MIEKIIEDIFIEHGFCVSGKAMWDMIQTKSAEQGTSEVEDTLFIDGTKYIVYFGIDTTYTYFDENDNEVTSEDFDYCTTDIRITNIRVHRADGGSDEHTFVYNMGV